MLNLRIGLGYDAAGAVAIDSNPAIAGAQNEVVNAFWRNRSMPAAARWLRQEGIVGGAAWREPIPATSAGRNTAVKGKRWRATVLAVRLGGPRRGSAALPVSASSRCPAGRP